MKSLTPCPLKNASSYKTNAVEKKKDPGCSLIQLSSSWYMLVHSADTRKRYDTLTDTRKDGDRHSQVAVWGHGTLGSIRSCHVDKYTCKIYKSNTYTTN